MGPTAFAASLAALTDVRARHPEAVAEAALVRRRRPLLPDDGRLLLVAADHPARGALGVRGDGQAMASRSDLLARLRVALARPGVDGVVATPDVVDDLLLLGDLDDRVVIGSMNRGGLQGAAFELDDRFTGYDARSLAAQGFEGGKMLVRIDPSDAGSVRTLEAAARVVGELADRDLVAMIEPFWSGRRDGRVVNDLSPEAVVRSVHVAQALGPTSARTWLKLPVVEEMERVVDATTLPTLLLGGDPTGHPDDTYERWARAVELPGVRGLVVGRALLYPADDDVAAAVDVASGIVHGGAS
ncbi:Cgl0159 family (beta/alpha)8-fold protein [Angustibacter aerolatus]